MRPLIARRLIVVLDVLAAVLLFASGLLAVVGTLLLASFSEHFGSSGEPMEEAVFIGVGIGLMLVASVRPLGDRQRKIWLFGSLIVVGVLLGPLSMDGMALMFVLAFLLAVLASTRNQLEDVASQGEVRDVSSS